MTPDEYIADLDEPRRGKSCVRFKKLEDLDRSTLVDLIRQTATGPYAQ